MDVVSVGLITLAHDDTLHPSHRLAALCLDLRMLANLEVMGRILPQSQVVDVRDVRALDVDVVLAWPVALAHDSSLYPSEIAVLASTLHLDVLADFEGVGHQLGQAPLLILSCLFCLVLGLLPCLFISLSLGLLCGLPLLTLSLSHGVAQGHRLDVCEILVSLRKAWHVNIVRVHLCTSGNNGAVHPLRAKHVHLEFLAGLKSELLMRAVRIGKPLLFLFDGHDLDVRHGVILEELSG
mmetsp:Transcript_20155/g.47176  ORF Transcript_20155/g.47176 Transcript_20155/m.47176 type:complete len:238 (+) Transcript_20155:2704-3417(+)